MFKKIDMTSFMPPPYGGVSVHVKRLVGYLRTKGFDLRTYRSTQDSAAGAADEHVLPVHVGRRFLPAGLSWLYKYGLKDRCDLVHCHYSVEWSYAMHQLRSRGIACVQTIHNSNAPRDLAKSHPLTKWAFKKLTQDMGMQYIAVSEAVARQLEGMGIRDNQICVIPAFIPPDLSCAEPLPDEMQKFVSEHSPILSVYAFDYFPNDVDKEIYRLDDALGALASLRQQYGNIGLVACVPNRDGINFGDLFRERVASMGLSDSVYIQAQAIDDAWRIWAASDVFLRPTSKDGDAVAVREALGAGTRVVASDATVRPKAARLHPTGNVDVMVSCIREELNQPRHPAESNDEYVEKVMDVYHRAYELRRW